MAFICEERMGDDSVLRLVPIATAFFVIVPSESNPEIFWRYIVTARHVIEESIGETLVIRINTSGDRPRDIRTTRLHWDTHDGADVASIIFEPTEDVSRTLEIYSIPIWAFVGAGPDYRYNRERFEGTEGLQVAIGQEVFFIGLFTQHYGRGKNLPIARFGHLSQMPSPVQLKRLEGSCEVVAYLAECLSWGGLSGSPVFWLHPMVVQAPATVGDKQGTMAMIGNFQAFLGLASGHFDIPKKAKTTGDVLGKIETELNSGIAIITPAAAIEELLMREDLKAERKRREKRSEKMRPSATPDIAERVNPLSRDSFENALKRASRKVSEPESKDSETPEL